MNNMKIITQATVIILSFYIAISSFFMAVDTNYFNPELQAQEEEIFPAIIETIPTLSQEQEN